MTFYLIGLGLNENSISAEALNIMKNCGEVYLESYTVNFPYSLEELEEKLKTKIIKLKREEVENELILKGAKEKDIGLLVYGDALSATTHIQLILACKNQNIKYQIFHNSSIITAIAETGLQVYKFGKTASMPNWKEHTNKPSSFINYIKENQSIKAHTLLLTDIGLKIEESINQLKEVLEKENLNIEKIIAISNAGTKKQKIFYDELKNLKEKNIQMPFCFIIPCELHFLEEEVLEKLKE